VFVEKLLSGEKIPIYGDGTNVREWIHALDHVRGIQVVLEKGRPGEIYNIGTGSHLSNNDLATELITLMELEQNMKSYVADRKGHDFRYSVNSRKIENLGFERLTDFQQGLLETINWYIDNQQWWE
jgi:dTDP-glucose 4,6-dehydratase